MPDIAPMFCCDALVEMVPVTSSGSAVSTPENRATCAIAVSPLLPPAWLPRVKVGAASPDCQARNQTPSRPPDVRSLTICVQPDEIDTITRWIDQGAPWPKEVTLGSQWRSAPLEPRKVEIPAAAEGSGLTNPIDLVLQPYFAKHNITPGKVVDDRVYARRVYLDILGILPPPADLETFVADSSQPFLGNMVDKLERLGSDLAVERETLAETLYVYMGIASHRTNKMVSRLTALSMIFLPLTFLCGVYGMNFHEFPEIKWPWGYAFFWTLAVGITAGLVMMMKRNRWI